jgi:hypothetical protein
LRRQLIIVGLLCCDCGWHGAAFQSRIDNDNNHASDANNWDIVMGLVDSQTALANDSWSAPGSWIDADMLTVGCNDNRIPGTPCDHGTPLTVVEEYSQMSLWCIFASNLML